MNIESGSAVGATPGAALVAALPGLASHRDRLAAMSMRQLFAADSGRFEKLSVSSEDFLLDFSKTRLDGPALSALLALAQSADVAGHAAAMFAGAAINGTEGRAVLHTALRADAGDRFRVGGEDVVGMVVAERERMLGFAEGVRRGAIAGVGGRFTDVINIGIGGSDLGPAMATRALRPWHDGPRLHYVSNVDGADIADTLATLDPARTLVLAASKTFTTVETLTNAMTARRWIVAALGEAAVAAHFAAMSTAGDKVGAFGITADRTFGFWHWVGGRYSVWSAIGLPLAIAIGAEHFGSFLAGARAMDRHLLAAPPAENLPVLLALIGVWHRNVWDHPALAVLPYAQRLARFPAYLQQLDMESNGKGVDVTGARVAISTGPVVFGEPGTNGQHAFFQLLHQGTDVVPAEFLVAAEGEPGRDDHQNLLLANCFAQSEALMRGRTLGEAQAELRARGMAEAAVAGLAPHRVFPGDRPSTTLLFRRLDPFTLGRLIALYEHKVFVQGVIWGVNSFDQWGVELGKELATGLLAAVEGKAPATGSGSTAGLVAAARALRSGGAPA